MNVGIRNLMKGRVGERGYEGESLTGKGFILLGGGFWILGGGRKHFGGGREHWFDGLFCFSGSVGEFFRL
jgi:hypothetical protein